MKLDFAIWFTLAMLVIALFAAFTGIAPPFVLTTTRCAPGYSEARFQRLPRGIPEKQVRFELGNPLFEFTNKAGESQFIYTRQGSGFAMHFHSRILCLSNGFVTEKISFVDYD